MNEQETINKYIELRPLYKKLAEKIAQIIREVLEINQINYHAPLQLVCNQWCRFFLQIVFYFSLNIS